MDLFVARQPIFDRRRNVVAYELLFRSGLQNAFGQNDPNRASVQMMDTTLFGFGLDSLVGDKKAYFNASRDVLVKEHWAVLPVGRSVIEVLETIVPDAEVAAACADIKKAGYQLALDDFVFRPEYELLLPVTDMVKVDFLATGASPGGAVTPVRAPWYHDAGGEGRDLRRLPGRAGCRLPAFSGLLLLPSGD